MWESLFSDVSFNKTLKNLGNGVNGALKALTSLNSSPPPPTVATSKRLDNDELIKKELSRLYPELEGSISLELHHRETNLISNFIKNPETYLSSSENKLATTKAIIKDIEGLEKDGRRIPQNIKKIITDHKKNSSIIKLWFKEEIDTDKMILPKSFILAEDKIIYKSHVQNIDKDKTKRFGNEGNKGISNSLCI
jgi:hypothetical protein